MVCLWDRKRNGSTITGKYSCWQMFEDDLRCYHDIFMHIISKSRRCNYYFLCDARSQESLSDGERGEARLPKNNRNNVFLTLN